MRKTEKTTYPPGSACAKRQALMEQAAELMSQADELLMPCADERMENPIVRKVTTVPKVKAEDHDAPAPNTKAPKQRPRKSTRRSKVADKPGVASTGPRRLKRKARDH